MTAFAHNGTGFVAVEAPLHEIYGHDGTGWRLIDGGAVEGVLLPVVGLTATSITDHGAVISWTLPTQPAVEPTEVWLDMPAAFGAVTIVLDAPATSWTHDALDSDTTYQVAVTLVRRVDGVVTVMSAPRSVTFDTDEAIARPPAEDPGGPPGGGIFPITPSPTPGPPGSGLCWFEWKLQILSLTTLTWTDTAFTGELAGSVTELEFDFDVLDATRTYRTAFREVCGGVAGDWQYGVPFSGVNDWTAPCGAIAVSRSASREATLMAEAEWSFPVPCVLDGRAALIDNATGLEVRRGAAYLFGIYPPTYTVPYPANKSEWWFAGSGGVVATLATAAVETAMLGAHTVSIDFAGQASSWSAGRRTAIMSIGMLHVIQLVEQSDGGWKVAVRWMTPTGPIDVVSNAVLPGVSNSLAHTISVQWPTSGNATLWIDGRPDVTFPVVELVDELPVSGIVLSTPANCRVANARCWARALTDVEMMRIADWQMRPFANYATLARWYDPYAAVRFASDNTFAAWLPTNPTAAGTLTPATGTFFVQADSTLPLNRRITNPSVGGQYVLFQPVDSGLLAWNTSPGELLVVASVRIPDETANGQIIWAHATAIDGSDTGDMIGLRVTSGRQFQAFARAGGSTQWSVATSKLFGYGDGTYHTVAMHISDGTVTLEVDGTSEVVTASAPSATFSIANECVGGRPGNIGASRDTINVMIAALGVFAGEMTVSERRAISNRVSEIYGDG